MNDYPHPAICGRRGTRAGWISSFLLIWISSVPSPGAAQAHPSSLVITNVVVIDGTGAPPRPGATIVITGDRISAVGAADRVSVPAGATVLDGGGRWVIPGLVDTHVHLVRRPPPPGEDTLRTLEPVLRRSLYYGVTAFREMSGSGVERRNVALKEAIERGTILGPRLYVSAPASPQNFERLAASDMRDFARRLVAFGVDGIKILHLSGADARTVIEEVRRISALPVYGHTWEPLWSPSARGVVDYTLEVVRAGLAGVVHVEGIAPTKPPLPAGPTTVPSRDVPGWWLYHSTLWLHTDPAREAELIAEMVRRRVWLEPTLVTTHFSAYRDSYADYPDNHLLPIPFERWSTTGLVLAGEDAVRYRAAFERMKDFVRRFSAAGGVVIAGSDGRPVPYIGVHEELRLLVEAGLSPMAALQAATINAARALGWEDRIGTIEAGKLADLVILDADPLQDIGNTRRIWQVIRGGRLLDRTMLLQD